MKRTPVVLLILDGWGIGTGHDLNAIEHAKTPNMDRLLQTYPNTTLGAAGEAIGLAAGHQGSTEIGHLIISAGRNVLLPQMQVAAAIENGVAGQVPAYANAIEYARVNNTRLHLMGLLSDAGVHAYDTLCYELLRAAKKAGLRDDQVYIHIFSDGRDTPPHSLPEHVVRLQAAMVEVGIGRIASLQGRFWVMDRDHNWGRVEAAYELLTRGKGRTALNIETAIAQARTAGETDEFISPTLIDAEGTMREGDAVINWNYRVDREIEITKAFVEEQFTEFARGAKLELYYAATLPYYEGMSAPAAFERTELQLNNTLPEVLASHNLSQHRITETEKWAYVTKIFNVMREEPLPGETRHLIPSDPVTSFDQRPEMQALEIATGVAEALNSAKHDVIIANICNADMVGHTGNEAASVVAIETIDRALLPILEAVRERRATLLITADHGNVEHMWDVANDAPHTQHTTNPVPFILVNDSLKDLTLRSGGALQDVAPTILDLLDIEKPADMTGSSLIQ